MGNEIQAILVGKWVIGYDHASKHTVVRIEFSDRPPLHLAFAPENAVDLAKAILDQQQNPPPKSDRLS